MFAGAIDAMEFVVSAAGIANDLTAGVRSRMADAESTTDALRGTGDIGAAASGTIVHSGPTKIADPFIKCIDDGRPGFPVDAGYCFTQQIANPPGLGRFLS